MVLLEKHVHLQKEGGAEESLAELLVEFQVGNDRDFSPAANTERKSVQSARRTTSRRGMMMCCQGAVVVNGIDGGIAVLSLISTHII